MATRPDPGGVRPPVLYYWLACLLLCAIALVVYSNSFQSGLVLDSRYFVLEDSRIRLPTQQNLALILNHTLWWPRAESGLYRPITTLSLLFNYAILGNSDHPAGYHWINLFLHTVNVLLVFALARRLMGDLRPAFLVAALWAVHPALTESVTNIAGRADLLAGVAILSALLMYLKSAEASGWPRVAWLVGVGAATTAGVFCKENAAAIPAVIALYELTWWKPGRWRGLLLSMAAMSPAFLAMWWTRSRVHAGLTTDGIPFVDNPIAAAGFWTGRLTAIKVLGKYLALLIWPAHLSADYSYPQIPLANGSPADWSYCLLVAALGFALIFLYRRNKIAFFAVAFAFVTLLPTSNLIIPIGTIMAERFLYLPAIGVSLCVTLILYSLASRTFLGYWAPFFAGLLIVAALGARTWARNADWLDDVTLWSAAVRTSPLSFKSHIGLAKALLAQDRDLTIDRALAEEEQGLALIDSLPAALSGSDFYIRAGMLYADRGDMLRAQPESASKYKRARELLLRGRSILHAEERDESANSNQASFRSDSDVFVDRLIFETERKLAVKDEEPANNAKQD